MLTALPVVLFAGASGDWGRICGVLKRTGEPALGDSDEPSTPDISDFMWTGDSVKNKSQCWS
jgi:hypothetical protein